MYFEDAISYDEMVNILFQNFDKIKFDEIGTTDSNYYNFSAKLESKSFMIDIDKTSDICVGGNRFKTDRVIVYSKDDEVYLDVGRKEDVIEWLIKSYHDSFDVEEYRHKLFDEFGV